MNPRPAFAVFLGLVAALISLIGCDDTETTPPTPEPSGSAQPNILLLLADDLGNNDLAISNQHPEIVTPNMDALASQGTRFTRFYTESTCSPSRVALLTGRYASRAGFRPVGRGIPPERITLPEAVRKSGYATHHVGKWHVGATIEAAHPLSQGFDTSFGFLNQWMLRRPELESELSFPTYMNPWLKVNREPRKLFKGHLTELLADHTVELIEGADRRTPWFIYHAFFAPHAPIEPTKRFSDRHPDTPGGRYHALLEQLDAVVGRILESLRTSGQFENTIVVLASDNGGTNNEFDNNYPFHGKKATYWEGGVRVPLIIHWPERFAPGEVFREPVAIFDLYPTLMDLISSPETPSDLDGVSLVTALRQPELLRRNLFWDSFVFHRSVYGVLTADDERLYHQLNGEHHLLDLAEDPFGNPEHAIDDPERSNRIRDEYKSWRSETQLVDTTWTPSDVDGRGVLSGDDFQRTPGLGGYTFAIGITPAAPEDRGGESQIIAHQRGLLKIALESDTSISVELDGKTMTSKPIEPMRCHSIVVSGFFYRRLSPISARADRRPILNLFVDGELVDLDRSEHDKPPDVPLSEPTHIGRDAEGRGRFLGQLSPPRVYNLAMRERSDASFPGIENIHPSVCPE